MPAEWFVRPAAASDYPTFTRFFADLATGDATPGEAQWAREMVPNAFFLESGDAPIAYGMAVVLDGLGYIHHVVVDRAWRGRAVGSALMGTLARRLRAAGCARWALNVKVDNLPALKLYRRWGLARAFGATALSLDWSRVPLLPRDPARTAPAPIDPADDPALEARFDLPRGRLASLRALPGRELLRLVDLDHPDAPAPALAVFVPSFPGAFPFSVARPTLAAPLLEAVHAFARPSDTFIRLYIENDPALASLLREAGAEIKLELDHMRGDIPPP